MSSRILRTEITRVLRREGGLPVVDRDHVLDFVDTIPLDHAVLQEAEAIIPHVRTLDAIHLASALRSGLEDLVIVTHDATMKSVAAAIGFFHCRPGEMISAERGGGVRARMASSSSSASSN